MPMVRSPVTALCTALLLAASPSRVAADGRARPSAALPPNIRVAAPLAAIVGELYARSPTFRRQCASIGASPRVRVWVLAGSLPARGSGPRARASISRHRYGAVQAVIVLPPLADTSELLPHEFEHVIEQMEGLDLPALARAGRGGVVEASDGTYETTRARLAGLAAAREVYDETAWPIAGIGRALRGVRFLAAPPVGPPAPVR